MFSRISKCTLLKVETNLAKYVKNLKDTFIPLGSIIPLWEIHSEETITDSQNALHKDIRQRVIYKI